jgi:hypothetical protein
MENGYELGIQSVVRYRIDPPPVGWMVNGVTDSDGWRANTVPDRKLRLTDAAIEVQGLGRLLTFIDPLWINPSLEPHQTTMWTTHLSWIVIGPWCVPWPKVDFLALTCTLPDDSEFTLAIRPWRGQFDRLKDALRTVGVGES